MIEIKDGKLPETSTKKRIIGVDKMSLHANMSKPLSGFKRALK